jgi:hypothetical protein
MKPVPDIAVLAASGCQGVAALAIARGSATPGVILHLAASACAAALLHRRMLQGSQAWTFALLYAAIVFLPVLGLLGLIAVALSAPGNEAPAEPDFIETRIPRPPGREPAAPSAETAPLTARQARVEELSALRPRMDPEAVGVLRRALEDGDEDVRLLAHALLESKNRAACRTIEKAAQELEEAPESRRAAVHRRLALQHWDLAWLGLVQGECLEHALAAARQHARAALAQQPRSPSLQFLLGRIELRLSAPEEAEKALIRARDLGMPAAVIRPYLAEAAFLRRRFDLVRSHFAEGGAGSPAGAVARMRRYWT